MPDFGFDDWMDAQLRGMPVPRHLHARLLASRPSAPTDEHLDEMLRDVSVPEHLNRRLRSIAWRGRRPSLWASLSIAASVLIVLGTGSYWALVRNTWARLEPGVASRGTPLSPQADTDSQPSRAPSSALAAGPAAEANRSQPPRRQRPVTIPLGQSRPVASDESERLSRTLQEMAGVGSSIRQAAEAKLKARSALGAGGRFEQLPPLEVLELPPSRGVAPPRLGAYDMLFHLRHGEHPFVSPEAHRDLRTSRVPFNFRTSSYDLAAAAVEAGRSPSADAIRVEDFLAAQRYALPPAPRGRVALHTAASPSPLNEAGTHFLQLAVQAGQDRQPRRSAVRLIAVVETSAAMQVDARDRTVERALADLTRHLSADDRMTVIGFAAVPRVLVEDAGPTELAELIASGSLREASGKADLAAAIQATSDALAATDAVLPRRIVFVTSGREAADSAGIDNALEPMAALGTPWQLIGLSSTATPSDWQHRVQAAGGRSLAAGSHAELSAHLAEILTGRSQAVARDVSLRIAFNPKAVAGYRMVGHETPTLTGESGDPLQIDLLPEQVATCMYELLLKPNDERDVAQVELTWNDASNGQPHRQALTIRRSQVSASFTEAPAWHQQGIVATRAAEFLRGSYYLPKSRRIDQLLPLVAQVDPQAADMAEFRALARLIERAAKLR